MSEFRKLLLAFAAVTLCAGIASAGLTVAPAPTAPAVLPAAEPETIIVVALADTSPLLNEASGCNVGTTPTFLARNEPLVLLIVVDDPAQPPGAIANNNPEPAIEPLTPDATAHAQTAMLPDGTLNLNFANNTARYPIVANVTNNGVSATNNNHIPNTAVAVDVGTASAIVNTTTAGTFATHTAVVAVAADLAAVTPAQVSRSGPTEVENNGFNLVTT